VSVRKPITKELRRVYSAAYREKHREEIRERQRKYWLAHEDQYRERSRRYSHTDKGRETKRTYERNRLTKLENRLKKNLRTRIWLAVKKGRKVCGTEELLGCTVEFLRGWLESQFVCGMSWKNYGKWHVDHIVPCAKFDLALELDQKKCFSYTNLQPLWAMDNHMKGKR
jgi:hypothetical protein